MEGVRVHRAPEVIVISDDESESSDNEPNSTALQPFSWSEVADRLLMLAKNRELRDDQVIATMLNDLGIPPSHDLRRSIQVVCEKLGELLVFWRRHDRRSRTCEGLVMVMCEVLSLVHTAPSVSRMTEPQTEPGVKEEVVDVTSNEYAMYRLYQLMNGWKVYMVELATFSDCKEHAVTATMERLDALSVKCSLEIERLQEVAANYEEEMENAAEEFVETLHKCQIGVDENLGMGEQAFKFYDDTFNKTEGVQSKFQEISEGRKLLVRRARDMEMHREFYRALLAVARTAAQIAHQRADQQLTSEQQVNKLGSKMLMEMDWFGAGLQAVMERSAQEFKDFPGSTDTARKLAAEQEYRPELLRFAKDLEEFWLIYRNWLPQVVLDMVIRMFDTLSGSNMKVGCPIRNAVSRVCTSLREDYVTQ